MKPITNSLKPYQVSHTYDYRRSNITRDSSTPFLGESKSPERKVKLFAIKTDKIAALLRSKADIIKSPERMPQPELLNNPSPMKDILDYDLFNNNTGYRSMNLLDAPRYMIPLSSRKMVITNNDNSLTVPPIIQPPVTKILGKKLPPNHNNLSHEGLTDKNNLVINIKQANNFFIGVNATPVNKPDTASTQMLMTKTIHSSHGWRLPKINVVHGGLMRKKKELSDMVSKDYRREKNDHLAVPDMRISGIHFKIPAKPRDTKKFRLNIDLSMQ
jgi:hypothetical protein